MHVSVSAKNEAEKKSKNQRKKRKKRENGSIAQISFRHLKWIGYEMLQIGSSLWIIINFMLTTVEIFLYFHYHGYLVSLDLCISTVDFSSLCGASCDALLDHILI